MSSKNEVIAAIQRFQDELEEAVSSLPEGAWSKRVYENGWNAREILCHIASTSGVAGFLLMLARSAGGGGLGGGFDEDTFNAQQVEMRKEKIPAELIGEIRGNFERDIDGIRSAPEDLIRKLFKAPWDVEGELGDVIVMSLEGHLGMHLADLRSAAQA